MDEKLIGILAAAAGVATPEAAELATTDEGIATLQTKITAKLADVKRDANGRALKIATAAFKAAGVDAAVFEDGREFKDNVAAAVEALQASASASPAKDLTDEQVLALKPVIALKNKLTLEADQRVQAAKQEVAESFKKEQEAFRREQNLVGVRAWAEQQVQELNPNFSDNATVAANQRKDLVNKIVNAGTYQKEGTGYVLVDEKGEILKDAMQNALNPAANARTIAESYYGLPTSTPKDSPGVKPGDVANGDTYTGPKTQDEVDAKLLELQRDTPAARAKVQQDYATWQAAQPKQ